jgi:hypothetical protein
MVRFPSPPMLLTPLLKLMLLYSRNPSYLLDLLPWTKDRDVWDRNIWNHVRKSAAADVGI